MKKELPHNFMMVKPPLTEIQKDLQEYFEDPIETFIKEFINVNDQTVWHHFHFCHYPDIQIDHKCEIFQCMGPNKIEFNL